MKKPRSWLRWALLALLPLGGCQPPPEGLRVGINTWPGYEPLLLARDPFAGVTVRGDRLTASDAPGLGVAPVGPSEAPELDVAPVSRG